MRTTHDPTAVLEDPNLVACAGLAPAMALAQCAGLTKQSPVLSSAHRIAYLDVDDTIKATHGYAIQGLEYGYNHVNASMP